MEHRRADRVGDLVLRELAEVLLRKVKDPRLAGVTLTEVEVSTDLRQARVFYSVLGGDEARAAAASGLDSARGFLKRQLGRTLELKHMPELVFFFDASLEHGSRMERLLDELKKSEGR
ncbi:MAG: 30S ribosome-binding factor RbfA [Syntrophobacteria bacterium]